MSTFFHQDKKSQLYDKRIVKEQDRGKGFIKFYFCYDSTPIMCRQNYSGLEVSLGLIGGMT